MNEPAPKTTGLQIAIIVAAMLATILAVTTYMLYRENLELKEELEQRKAQASGVIVPRGSALPRARQQRLAESFHLPFGLST